MHWAAITPRATCLTSKQLWKPRAGWKNPSCVTPACELKPERIRARTPQGCEQGTLTNRMIAPHGQTATLAISDIGTTGQKLMPMPPVLAPLHPQTLTMSILAKINIADCV